MAAAKPITELIVDDVGGAFTVGLAYIGDKLGLFAALAALGRASSGDVARRAGCDERYVREWLNAMVAARYVERDPAGGAGAYFMTPEQRAALVDEAARTFAAGAFQLALPSLLLTPRVLASFQRGGGIAFGALPAEIPAAIDRMHRPWFEHMLVPEWLPAAPGLVEALGRGIAVLDVGCGVGRSTLAIGAAFPRSAVLGVDAHAPSIDAARARARARDAGAGNVSFTTQPIEDMPAGGRRFDLIVAIDCVHDMVDPGAALRTIKALLAPGGVVFWSEPAGSHEPLDNRNPQGRLRASLSPYHCLTVSLAAGGAGLGTLIGEAGARALAAAAGFASFETLSVDSKTQQFFLLRS